MPALVASAVPRLARALHDHEMVRRGRWGGAMKVSDVMVGQVATIGPQATTNEALGEMSTRDVGALPVIDQSNRVVGMITDRDIAMACFARNQPPSAIPVREVMSTTVWTVNPDEPATRAESVMANHQVRRLPVCGPGGQLLGIVTVGDLARAANAGGRAVKPGELVKTLGAITSPQNRRP
jgi:CBS domain-containing protein